MEAGEVIEVIELFEALSKGADAAVIVLAALLWRIDRRLFQVEIKLLQLWERRDDRERS